MSYFDTIYADTFLPHRAIPVYMYLKDRSGSTGSCWPGIKTIAKDLNLSRSTVKCKFRVQSSTCTGNEPHSHGDLAPPSRVRGPR